ncbi:uncharacterized protein LOC128203670 isoform X2 [Mya arenaria]|uniref:uncharacterized protein LOC128203670 isoform X2 n=1 Tax=Mya arenaria TaxID=6604 RepID=UPI0022E13ABE|nr:uncharacterized protein LOC128203670 isoform X2 [Mya arenaria]
MSARSTFMEEMDHLKSILTHYQLMAGEKHLQENSTQSGHLERKLMAAFIHKMQVYAFYTRYHMPRKADPGSCRHCTRSRNTDRMSMDITFGYVCIYRSECFPKRTVVTKRSPS